MSKHLPMATEPSVRYDCDFHLIELPNRQEHHLLLWDFVIETKTRTISESIALFLGISYEACIDYIGKNNFTPCQFPNSGFKGHYCRYRGITLDQLRILWDKTRNNRADKYKPILSELILTQVLPLFNRHDKNEITVMTKQLSTENNSQKFHNDLFGDLTVLTQEDGTLWFIGKEVAEKLGYARPNDAITQHCKHTVKHRIKLNQNDTRGSDMLIIPESDLYRLVMRSKLPDAEKFEDWVTKDILPSIRKTGSYGQPAELSRKDLLLLALKSEEENEKLQLELKSKDEQIEADKSFTKLGKMMTMADATIKVGDYAIMLQNEHGIKIGQNRLFEWFREHGYLCKEEKQKNRPTQKSMELGLFSWTERIITTNHGEEIISFTPRLTGKAQVYFIDKLIKDFGPHAA